MIDPRIVKALQESPHFKELTDYLFLEAMKLNTLNGIDTTEDLAVVALQVAARKEAFNTVSEILEPLINVQEYVIMPNAKEYTVDVPKD